MKIKVRDVGADSAARVAEGAEEEARIKGVEAEEDRTQEGGERCVFTIIQIIVTPMDMISMGITQVSRATHRQSGTGTMQP